MTGQLKAFRNGVRFVYRRLRGLTYLIQGEHVMADIISDLAAKSGVSPDMARKGMGAVIEFCKGKLSPDAYSKVSAAVPDADGMVAQSQQAQQAPAQSAGGILGGLTGAAGKLFGGGGSDAADLFGKLTRSGF